MHVLNHNADEFGKIMPEAAEAIKRNSYMDDYLDSVATPSEAISRIKQVREINKGGGFRMHKWASNNASVMHAIPELNSQKGSVDIELTSPLQEFTKTLGLIWKPTADVFTFKVNLRRMPRGVAEGTAIPTKRQMLSIVMSVFDPLGFICPFSVRSRIILQDVWRSSIGWDSKLKEPEFVKWKRWIDGLIKLENINIPRCHLKPTSNVRRNELHAFSDASKEAYAAVVYRRMEYDDGSVEVEFVAGKGQVAPIKPTAIPRLELQGALMAVHLVDSIQKEMDVKFNQRTLYTDSRTVLTWIQSEPRQYRPFVAFRLGEIEELSEASEWQWIKSVDNPADDATRDVVADLNADSRWLKGPDFLRYKVL